MSTHRKCRLSRRAANRLFDGAPVDGAEGLALLLAAMHAAPSPRETSGERAAAARFRSAHPAPRPAKRTSLIKSVIANLFAAKIVIAGAIAAAATGGIALVASNGARPARARNRRRATPDPHRVILCAYRVILCTHRVILCAYRVILWTHRAAPLRASPQASAAPAPTRPCTPDHLPHQPPRARHGRWPAMPCLPGRCHEQPGKGTAEPGVHRSGDRRRRSREADGFLYPPHRSVPQVTRRTLHAPRRGSVDPSRRQTRHPSPHDTSNPSWSPPNQPPGASTDQPSDRRGLPPTRAVRPEFTRAHHHPKEVDDDR